MFNQSDWALASERRREQIERAIRGTTHTERRRRFKFGSLFGDHT